MGLFKKKKADIKLQLIDCDYGPDDLAGQLPISCQLIRMIPGNDRPDYWLAKSDCSIKYGDCTIDYLVFAARFVGAKIEKGMGTIVLNVAYVIDETLLQDTRLNFDKCQYVAICRAVEYSI